VSVGARNAIQLSTTANQSQILISTAGTSAHVAISAPLSSITTTALTTTNVATTAFKVQNVSGTDKMNIDASLTTIRNTTISLTDNTPTTRFTQNNGTTTLTNTSINLTGSVYASSYSMGTSASNSRLFSFRVNGSKQGGTDPDGVIIMNPMYDTTTNRCFNYCMPCHVVFTKVTIMYDIDSSTSTTMTLQFIKKTSNAGTETTVGYSPGFATTVNSTTSYTQVVNLISATLLIGAEYSADDIMKVNYAGSPSNEWGIVFHGYQLP
jgi:hypothetical protein